MKKLRKYWACSPRLSACKCREPEKKSEHVT
jgi:hypothetical protein